MMNSKRLNCIASLVPNNAIIADVGTDHAYLPIELIKTNKCQKALAIDVLEGPLNQARIDIASAGLEANIKCILSDGLKSVYDSFDCIVIAGLGGSSIKKILEEGKTKLSDTIIIQTNNDAYLVRKYLTDNGYLIDNEVMIEENNLFYPIVRFIKGNRNYSEMELKYGPLLIAYKDKTLLKQIKLEFAYNETLLAKIPLKETKKREIIQNNIALANKLIKTIE